MTLFSSLQTWASDNWPNWRGPDNQGRIDQTELPLSWAKNKNVVWKFDLPDRGNSTPVVWGNKIFLTQAIEEKNQRNLICLDFESGKQLWTKGVTYDEPESTHRTNPYCSASPVVNESKVIALFGSAGLVCWDHDGNKLWDFKPGKQSYEWGNGSSPILWNDTCIFYFGPGPEARMIGLNINSGEKVWSWKEPSHRPEKRSDGFRGNRNGMVCTYSSPVLMKLAGNDSVVMLFPGFIRGFDPRTGHLQWESPGLNPLVYASPVGFGNTVVGMGGYSGTTIATDVNSFSKDPIKPNWTETRTKNRLGSAVIASHTLGFVLNTPGFLEAFNPKSGESYFQERLPAAGPSRESWSSLVLAGDKVFCFNQSGDTIIVSAKKELEVLAVNGIGNELTNSSPVIVRDRLLLRTHKSLWCFGNNQKNL